MSEQARTAISAKQNPTSDTVSLAQTHANHLSTPLDRGMSRAFVRPSTQADESAAELELAPPNAFIGSFGGIRRYLQAKLVVGASDDPAEDEADVVAEQVMRKRVDEPGPKMVGGVRISRKPASDTEIADDASEAVEPVLKSGGEPLDSMTRGFMESRFGHDFSSVRVHTGSQAAQSAEAVNARAYTVGSNIVFGSGAFEPHSSSGKQLIAHELAHVLQQSSSVRRMPNVLQRKTKNEAAESDTSAAEADTSDSDNVPAEETPAAPSQSLESATARALVEVSDTDVAAESVGAIPSNPVALQETRGGAEEPASANGVAEDAISASTEAEADADAPGSQARDGESAAVAQEYTDTSNVTAAAETAGATAATGTALPESASADPDDDTLTKEADAAAELAGKLSGITQPKATGATSAPTSDTVQPISGGNAVHAIRSKPRIQNRTAQRLIQRKEIPTSAPVKQDVASVSLQVSNAAGRLKKHERPAAKAHQAAAAAEMPPQEKRGKARAIQTGEVLAAADAQETQGANAFNKAEFIESVTNKINQLTPKNPKSMENIENSGVFSSAKQVVDAQVRDGKKAAQGDVAEKAAAPPNTDAVPEKDKTDLRLNDPGAAATVDASGAAPKAKATEAVEAPIHARSAQLDSQMAAANVTPGQLQNSNEPQFQQSLAAKDTAQSHAATAPGTYRTQEKVAIQTAQAGANTQVGAGLAKMFGQRGQSFAEMDRLQSEAKGTDEQKRAEIGQKIDSIYTATTTDVQSLLTALDGAVTSTFSRGTEEAKSAAIQYIKHETTRYKEQRYEGLGGTFSKLGDWAFDMPAEYFEFFREGRELYSAKLGEAIAAVADIVADHMARAKERIQRGRGEIAEFVKQQPKALRAIAQQMAGDASDKFRDLEQTVDAKKDELVDALAAKYQEAEQALNTELDTLMAEDKGLWAQAKDALSETIGTIKQLKDMLAGALAAAASVATRIIENPIGFLSNLITAVKQGLTAFAGNIGAHLQQGLIGWLTGALGSAGITLPEKFDAAGIFQMVASVLGVTWQNIRGHIVRGLGPKGEQIMGGLEKAWDVLQVIREKGLVGLWGYVQNMIGDIKSMVMDQIKSMLETEIIKAGIDWLIGILGGPAGAFIKAVQFIVRIVTWFMNNAARVAALVNSVVSSIGAIAKGDVAGAAKYIENSLAKAVPVMISFLADLLGLGGVAKRVQAIITKAKALIDKAIKWVVGKALAIGRKLIGLFGGGAGQTSETEAQKQARLTKGVDAGVAAMNRLKGKPIGETLLNSVLGVIKMQNRLGLLEPIQHGGKWAVHGELRRMVKDSSLETSHESDRLSISLSPRHFLKTMEKFIRPGKNTIILENRIDLKQLEAAANEEYLRSNKAGRGRFMNQEINWEYEVKSKENDKTKKKLHLNPNHTPPIAFTLNGPEAKAVANYKNMRINKNMTHEEAMAVNNANEEKGVHKNSADLLTIIDRLKDG